MEDRAVSKPTKRRPVRTETHDEDDTLRLAHILKRIQRRGGWRHSRNLVVRAFAFNGDRVKVVEVSDAD